MNIEEFVTNAPDAWKEALVSKITGSIPAELENALATVSDKLPSTIELLPMLKFVFFYGACLLALGVFARLLLGKHSSMTQALTASIEILLIYVVTIAIYTFRPMNLSRFLTPLPFASFFGDYLFLVPFHGTSFNTICSNILSMILLAFLVNLLNSLLPDFDSIISWYIVQILFVVLAMGLHLGANYIMNAYLPVAIVTHAPAILLVLLGGLMLLGVIKVLLGIALVAVSPVIAGIYTFFFASRIGKQLTKATLSTGILCAVLAVMEKAGYCVIAITPGALISYIPLILSLLVLWYLLGHEI